jgi:hypothetical protein
VTRPSSLSRLIAFCTVIGEAWALVLLGHVSVSVTETVYRHEIRPALTKGAAAMDKIFKKKTQVRVSEWLPVWLPKIEKGPRRISETQTMPKDAILVSRVVSYLQCGSRGNGACR